MSAIAVAMLYGSWQARAAATVDLAALVFVGHLFQGLSTLEVAAVGHTTAIAVSVLLASILVWQARHQRPGHGSRGRYLDEAVVSLGDDLTASR